MALATIEVRTRLLPPLSADLDTDTAPSDTSWIVRFLRPSFSVQTPFGSYTRAPWGDPGESTWPLGPVVLVGIVGLLVVGLLHLGKRVL